MVNTYELNNYHYSAVIDACTKTGKWTMALKLIRDMAQNRVESNTITYCAAISACEKGQAFLKLGQGEPEKARRSQNPRRC